MILLDTYGPPRLTPALPPAYEAENTEESSYVPQIDSYGSPTADPVTIVKPTSYNNHQQQHPPGENLENNNVDTFYSLPSRRPPKSNLVAVSTSNNLLLPHKQVTGATPIKTSYTKSPVRPVNNYQQQDYTSYSAAAAGSYGIKLQTTTHSIPKYKLKKPVNFANIDGYGSPLADPIRDIERGPPHHHHHLHKTP